MVAGTDKSTLPIGAGTDVTVEKSARVSGANGVIVYGPSVELGAPVPPFTKWTAPTACAELAATSRPATVPTTATDATTILDRTRRPTVRSVTAMDPPCRRRTRDVRQF